MRVGVVNKQPAERFSYTVDYSGALTDGDNVQTAVAEVSPAGLVVDNVSAIDPRVRFWAAGGEHGTTYKVTLTVGTADGRVFQDEIVFKIKEL